MTLSPTRPRPSREQILRGIARLDFKQQHQKSLKRHDDEHAEDCSTDVGPTVTCPIVQPPASYGPTLPDGSTEGSLIEVTFNGIVGVVLNESLIEHERAAIFKALRNEDFLHWRRKILSQTRNANYRLQFRPFFTGDYEHTGPLSLPPHNIWDIDLLTKPYRGLYYSPGAAEGTAPIDAVMVQYSFKTVIVTDYDSALLADPLLGTINGTLVEEINLPLDPYEVIQRTGKACLVESNYPLYSWDTELADALFLDYCTADNFRPLDSPYGECVHCHCTLPYPELDCTRALELTVGRVPTLFQFKRLPWDKTLAAQWEYFPNGEDFQVSANMVPYSQDLLEQTYEDTEYFAPDSGEVNEKCVGTFGWRQRRAFSGVDYNRGLHDVYVGPFDYNTEVNGTNPTFQKCGFSYYDPIHRHYHSFGYANYSAVDRFGTYTSGQSKRGFCQVNSQRVVNSLRSRLIDGKKYADCTFQGISPGMADNYQIGIPCQAVDTTNLAPGKITLKVEVNAYAVMNECLLQCNASNPSDVFLQETSVVFCTEDGLQCSNVSRGQCAYPPGEEDGQAMIDDNAEEYKFVHYKFGESLVTERESRYGRNQEIGPYRNCGFSQIPGQTHFECAIGTNVTLSCSLPKAHVEKDLSEVLRVCEWSRKQDELVPCRDHRALAMAVVTPGAATNVTFACPAARDPIETGGAFGLLRANFMQTIGRNPRGTMTCARVA